LATELLDRMSSNSNRPISLVATS